MVMSENIYHKGVIERMEGDKAFVRIVQQSACAACHAQSMCSVSGGKVKWIEVTVPAGRFHVNEEVTVCGRSSLGLKAVLIAFVLPLVAVVAAIATGLFAGWTEIASALGGLLFLALYYGVLYFLRDKLKKQFVFILKKTY
jgi:sigma-E factor negative regulatory protein RseC